MKKIYTLIVILVVCQAHGQENQETKNLRIFKFNPMQLITSSLSFGYESFNKTQTRSMVFNVGIRYKNDDNNYLGVSPLSGGEILDQFTNWRGVTASLERRFYIPKLQTGKGNFLISEKGRYGVYISPSLRFDYNNNNFDQSFYDYKYKPDGGDPEPVLVYNSGKVNYTSIMPAMNFGIQFTLFQYAYIDLQIGGGLRLQNEKMLESNKTNRINGFYQYYDGLLTGVFLKEGVQPTGGVTIGVQL